MFPWLELHVGEKIVMNKYVFAALSIAVAIGPASALDAGLGGKAGGIGVGAGVGVGREGASLGGGASADGVGGANLGGSVGTGNGAPSASVGAGGNVGGVGGANLGGRRSGNGARAQHWAQLLEVGRRFVWRLASGLSAGSGRSAGGSTGIGGGSGSGTNSSGASVGIGQSQGTRNTIVALPGALMPHFRIHPAAQPGAFRSQHIGAGYLGLSAVAQNRAEARHSNAVVRVCQQAIFSAAKPLGAVGVQAASAGPVRRQRNGLTAPLSVRIDYGKEVRQATDQLSSRRERQSHRGDIGHSTKGPGPFRAPG